MQNTPNRSPQTHHTRAQQLAVARMRACLMLLLHKLKGIQLLDWMLAGSYFISLLLQAEQIGWSDCITQSSQQEHLGNSVMDGWLDPSRKADQTNQTKPNWCKRDRPRDASKSIFHVVIACAHAHTDQSSRCRSRIVNNRSKARHQLASQPATVIQRRVGRVTSSAGIGEESIREKQ